MTSARRLAVVVAGLLIVAAFVALRSCGDRAPSGDGVVSRHPVDAPVAGVDGSRRRASDHRTESARPPSAKSDAPTATAVDPTSPSRTATFSVVDSATGEPIVGARVSDWRTETDRAPLMSLTGADGLCVVRGLPDGERRFLVAADRHAPTVVTWTGGDVRVALDPRAGRCTVAVKVVGPGGTPLHGIRVSHSDAQGSYWIDREATTDSSGRAAFADVAPGPVCFGVDLDDWRAAMTAGKWDVEDALFLAQTDVEDGKSYEFVLGAPPPGKGSIDARLLCDDGAPIAGAELHVDFRGKMLREVTTDSAGAALVSDLRAGDYHVGAKLAFDPWASWHFDAAFVLREGEHATKTWTLGTHVIRGRVVAGADRHGVADADVTFLGGERGEATSGADGRFELPHARSGSYEITAREGARAAVPRNVVIPADGEIVVELLEYGRVVVRFLASDRPQLRTAKVRLIDAATSASGKGRMLGPGSGDDDFVGPQILPGRYEVEVTVGDRSKRWPVEVRSNEASVVEVDAP